MLPTWCHRAGTRVAGVKRARLAPLCRSAPRRRPHTAAPCAQHQHQHQHLQRGGAATETDPLKRLRRVSHMLWGHAKARTLQPSLVRHAAHQGRDALAEVARCTSEAEAFRHAAGLVWALARLRCDALAPDLFGDIVGTSARVALAVLHPAVRDLHRAASRSATERAQRHIRLHLRASCRLLAWAACLTGAPGGAAVAEFLAAVMQASPAMHGDTTAPGAAAGGCARGTWEHLQCWEEAQWYQAHVAMVLSGPDPVATLPPELADKYRESFIRPFSRGTQTGAQPVSMSALHAAVARALSRRQLRFRNEVVTDLGYVVDLAVTPQPPQPRQPLGDRHHTNNLVGHDMAIEVDGPSHFLSVHDSTPEEQAALQEHGASIVRHEGSVYAFSLGTSVQRHHLAVCGWDVVSVPFFMWPRHDDIGEHLDLVAAEDAALEAVLRMPLNANSGLPQLLL